MGAEAAREKERARQEEIRLEQVAKERLKAKIDKENEAKRVEEEKKKAAEDAEKAR